jgi:hypothetical protein
LSSSSSSCCVLCLCACILSAILALTSSGMASWGCGSCGLGFEGLGALGVGWFWMLPAGESWEGSASLSFEDGVRWESDGRFWGCCRSGCQCFIVKTNGVLEHIRFCLRVRDVVRMFSSW